MKKIYFLAAIALFLGKSQLFAQWTTTGTNTSTDNNVAIGSTSVAPLTGLHVISNEDAISWPVIFNNLRNNSTVSGYGIGLKLKHSNNGELTKWGGIASIQEQSWANSCGLALYANETEHVRISGNGNVGIGTASPGSALQVGNYDSNETVTIASTQNGTGTLYFKDYNSTEGGGIKVTGMSGGSKMEFFNRWDTDQTKIIFDLYNGSVGIGTTSPDPAYKLSVNGSIRSKEVKVETGWSDFVFEEDYTLRSLEEVETYIAENKHLPEIPSEAEVTENGINLGEMNAKLLQKIEELTLYLIEQNKQLQVANQNIEALQKEVAALKSE